MPAASRLESTKKVVMSSCGSICSLPPWPAECSSLSLYAMVVNGQSYVFSILYGLGDGGVGWKCSGNRVIFSSGAIFPLFSDDLVPRTGNHYGSTFYYETDFLKEMVVQELTGNDCSEVFTTTNK